MRSNDIEGGGSVALYWDFENLHAGVLDAKQGDGSYARSDNRFKPQEPVVEVQAIVEFGASFGPVAINRAYGNWQYFGRYRDALLQSAVELIQLFAPGASAKNGADIKLCLDATEDIARFAHIGTVIIIGGDSDFMPVAQKIKAAGRMLVGIGNRRNTNKHWAKSCAEFRFYDSLVQPANGSEPAPAEAREGAATPGNPVSAADMVCRAIRLLSEAKGEPWVNKGSVWPMIKRLDPTFDLREHGHAGFAELVKSLGTVVEVKKGESDHFLHLRSGAQLQLSDHAAPVSV